MAWLLQKNKQKWKTGLGKKVQMPCFPTWQYNSLDQVKYKQPSYWIVLNLKNGQKENLKTELLAEQDYNLCRLLFSSLVSLKNRDPRASKRSKSRALHSVQTGLWHTLRSHILEACFPLPVPGLQQPDGLHGPHPLLIVPALHNASERQELWTRLSLILIDSQVCTSQCSLWVYESSWPFMFGLSYCSLSSSEWHTWMHESETQVWGIFYYNVI